MQIIHTTVDGSQPVPEFPWADAAERALAHVADGLVVKTEGDVAEGYKVRCFRGSGIIAAGAARIQNNLVERCWTGIEVRNSDTFIGFNQTVKNHRDQCLLVRRDCGNVQSLGNHYYGSACAARLEPCDSFRSDMDTYADAKIGLSTWGWNGTWTNCKFQHCWGTAVEFHGPGNELNGCQVFVKRSSKENPIAYGVCLLGDNNSVLGGLVQLDHYIHSKESGPAPAHCALLVAGNKCEVNTRLVDWDSSEGSIGMRTSGAIWGGRFTFRTSGFHAATDRLLIVDNPKIRDCHWEFRGEDIDITKPSKYVSIPKGWDVTNMIVLQNTKTGAGVQLTPGKLY